MKEIKRTRNTKAAKAEKSNKREKVARPVRSPKEIEAMKEEIEKAIEVLRRGGVILYPTDTVWGLGCDATNEKAVQRIYELKKSMDKKSMLVLLDNVDNVLFYVDKVPDVAWDLFEVNDKPTTLILSNAKAVAPNLIPEDNTLGIRITTHDFCRRLLYKLRRPLVSTSANIAGGEPALKLRDVPKEIVEGVDMVISPKYEGNPTYAPSTIIMLGEDSSVRIIRK